MTTSGVPRYCSVCARQAGLDPGGHVGAAAKMIAVELPLPWPRTLFSDSGRLPPPILLVIEHIRNEYLRTQELVIGLMGIAPDPEYSIAGMRRMICWERPHGPFAQFSQVEYLVPEDQFGQLVYALAVAPEQIEEFVPYRLPTRDVRDLLVCTHGNVDAACSKFGYPTYAYLRQLATTSIGTLRVWRTTHFGGHVFAPTLIDLPHGSYWAYIEREEADLLAHRNGTVQRLLGHYRGWAGLSSPYLQVLERALFVQHGWPWLAYPKIGYIIAQHDMVQDDGHGVRAPAWAEVGINYTTPDGTTGSVRARVETTGHLETFGSTGDAELYPYPQYSIVWME